MVERNGIGKWKLGNYVKKSYLYWIFVYLFYFFLFCVYYVKIELYVVGFLIYSIWIDRYVIFLILKNDVICLIDMMFLLIIYLFGVLLWEFM